MKKELTMEVRLLIAFVLVGLVLLVSQYFIKPAPAPTATKEGAAKSAQPVTPAAVEKPQGVIPSGAKERAAETAGVLQAAGEETFAVDTDVFHVLFSNRGAVVLGWILKDYRDHTGKPLELVYQPGKSRGRRWRPILTRRCSRPPARATDWKFLLISPTDAR
jgi:YidC/Oxa1 family membrane protein insertase